MELSDIHYEFLGVKDIMEICHVGRSKAYQIIRELNDRAKEENSKAFIIRGKVNAEYVRRFWKEKC